MINGEMLVVIGFMLISGFLLMAIEILLIPGFGVAGVLSLGLLGFAAYLSFIKLGTFWGICSIALSLAVAVILVSLFPRTRLAKKFILHDVQSPAEGFLAHASSRRVRIGDTGVALSNLRPSGPARFPDEPLLDVISDGEFIEKYSPIQIVRIEGQKIVIERLPG
jgi:membrane-bound serine protease (ClpP class)